MNAEQWVIAAVVLLAVSGVPGFFFDRRSFFGQRLAALLVIVGCGCGLIGAVGRLSGAVGQGLTCPSPTGGTLTVGVDFLSAFFLLPVLLVSLCGAVYGVGYWKATEHPENHRKLSLFYGLLAAAMTLLVVARDGVLFLYAWEAMALSAFFLVATEDHDQQVREAAWIYLAASHFATLCLVGLFALMWSVSGTFDFVSLEAATPGLATAIFLVALLGFGTKAGVMPLHIWLPSAHAMAPSHVSALLSGVMIKMGIYGLVRIGSLLPHPPLWWGGLVLGLGVISGVLGVAFAIGQHDLKRLLAYHSIENIGIILLGLGLALVGRSLGQVSWVVLGLGGALLHVWNHALFKSLLFLSAGSVIHAVGTREIDLLGGLAKPMPRTAVLFLIGAVAICGLPPLNGFVSELLIYLGLFKTLGLKGSPGWPIAAFAAPALALMGVLAAACFAKVFGAVFLGVARSEHARRGHEAPVTMFGPMCILATCCAAIGLLPVLVAPWLEQAARAWTVNVAAPEQPLVSLAPLGRISVAAAALIALTVAIGVFLRQRLRSGEVASTLTWDCGFAAPSPRMQYTASSFAQMLVDLFAWALLPRRHEHRPKGLFPQQADFHTHVPETVLDRGIGPSFAWAARFFTRFRVLQRGSLQVYLLYIFATLILLLVWS
ncbi:MAG TPA: proton-conducting transporter membrane subunit [Pirellulales bacterium]|nr:proton-conducting transporter membrane subunit [Pirellulales bacterium]